MSKWNERVLSSPPPCWPYNLGRREGESSGEGEIPLTLALSRQGRENQEVRLPRPEKSGLAMTRGESLSMTLGWRKGGQGRGRLLLPAEIRMLSCVRV